MMTMTYVCPSELCQKFDGDEVAKAAARFEVIMWLKGLRIEQGDIAYIPNGDTGELEPWTFDGPGFAASVAKN